MTYAPHYFSLNLKDEDKVLQLQSAVEKIIFDWSHNLKKLLLVPVSTVLSSTDAKGVKLPRLDFPTFNMDILVWKTFWEQFCTSIHDKSSLSKSEKLIYMQHALKETDLPDAP